MRIAEVEPIFKMEGLDEVRNLSLRPAVDLDGIQRWEELTGRGGEGMVVKPRQFIAQGQRGLIQPSVKCRGREYLRIIYGPEYTAPATWSACGRAAYPPSAP